MRRWLKAGSVALLLFLVVFVGKLLWDAGVFTKIEPHFAGQCHAVGPIAGPEDIEIARRQGLAFVTSDDRYPKPGEISNGAIYVYSLAEPSQLRKAWQPAFEFHPHGLGIFERAGAITLFAVNHRATVDTIEVLEFRDGRLHHLRSIRDPLLYNTNDVAAIDSTRFYVTHDHGAHSELGKNLERFSRIGRGFVSYYDGRQFRVVASALSFANGIAVSGESVLVASMTGRKLLRYRRGDSGALTLEQSLDLPSGPDNLSLGTDGSIWIGAHPKLLALKKRSHDPQAAVPAQVLRVSPDLSPASVEEVYLNDGSELAAASVAVPAGSRLLLGSVFDSHFLDCHLPPPFTSAAR